MVYNDIKEYILSEVLMGRKSRIEFSGAIYHVIPSLYTILKKVTEGNNIKAGFRTRELTSYKNQTLSRNYSLREIGENIGISKAAVWKLIGKE